MYLCTILYLYIIRLLVLEKYYNYECKNVNKYSLINNAYFSNVIPTTLKTYCKISFQKFKNIFKSGRIRTKMEKGAVQGPSIRVHDGTYLRGTQERRLGNHMLIWLRYSAILW